MASNFPVQVMGNYPPDRVRYFPVTAAQTFVTGALVVLTTGALVECGADPSLILGVAMGPASVGLATAGSIFGGTNLPVFVLTPADTAFMASATTPVFATHVATAYGVVKSTNWLVDISDTTNTRVTPIDVSNSPQQEGFYVRFSAANLQLDAIAS